MIDSIYSYFVSLFAQAREEYHVNPWLFIIFMVVSTPVYYYGYYLMGKSLVKIDCRKIVRKEVDKRKLRRGIGITVFGWYFPYVYVMVFGTLPLWLWVLLIAWVAVLSLLLLRTLRAKTRGIRMNYEAGD